MKIEDWNSYCTTPNNAWALFPLTYDRRDSWPKSKAICMENITTHLICLKKKADSLERGKEKFAINSYVYTLPYKKISAQCFAEVGKEIKCTECTGKDVVLVLKLLLFCDVLDIIAAI